MVRCSGPWILTFLLAAASWTQAAPTATARNPSWGLGLAVQVGGSPTPPAPVFDPNVQVATLNQEPASGFPSGNPVQGNLQLQNLTAGNSVASGLPAASDRGAADSADATLALLQSLPARNGQVLQTYDLRPYTHQITTTQSPQKAVVDWILRETGSELWFNEPLGILHATREQLYVYHTPEVQAVVKSVVDRFLQSGGRQQMLGLKLVAVGNPNWRATAAVMMQPIEMQTAGVEGWMLSRENAAILLNQLRRRADFSEHGGGDLTAQEGQRTIVTRTRPIDFVHAVRWVPGQVPGFQTLAKRIDEGYNLEISFLTGPNGTIDAVLRCDVDQVEKLQSVAVEIPNAGGRGQTVPVQVPQIVSWRLQERFRWPADQVLLLSCGVVANPTEAQTTGFNIQSLLNGTRRRADALLMIEYKGPVRQNAAPQQAANPGLQPVPQPVR